MPLLLTPKLISGPSRMDRFTGKLTSDYEHLLQSITDILSTPLGSRVGRRDYGSALFSLLDHPINRILVLKMHQAILVSIGRWEPRVKISQSRIDASAWAVGRLYYDLFGTYRISGAPLNLERLELSFYGRQI